jgi:hypothetical protein
MHGEELIPLLMIVLLCGLLTMAYAVLTEDDGDDDADIGSYDLDSLHPYSYGGRRDDVR